MPWVEAKESLTLDETRVRLTVRAGACEDEDEQMETRRGVCSDTKDDEMEMLVTRDEAGVCTKEAWKTRAARKGDAGPSVSPELWAACVP